MPFPETERVIYKKNPLDKVICQLRFPPILRIDSEVPSTFQDAIGETFPLYKENNVFQHEISMDFNQQNPSELMKNSTISSTNKNHEFASENNTWKINLTRTYISISTSQYKCWEDFIEKFKKPIEALVNIYKPPFFTRTGLRYIDIFDRSKLGLEDTKWTDLLKPYFIGLLSTELSENIKRCENIYEIKLADDKSTVRIATSFVFNIKTNEQCFLVDSDFYYPNRINESELGENLNFLHERATRLIRYIIQDKLHKAMEPQKSDI